MRTTDRLLLNDVRWVIGLIVGCWLLSSAASAEPRYVREVRFDSARQRHVGVRISFPKSALSQADQKALPVFLFSTPQGWRWGGHKDYYEYLAEEMGRRGIAMVTVSHFDEMETQASGEVFSEIYPGILAGDRHDAPVDRYEDNLFVLNELEQLNREQRATLPTFDVGSVAVGGHSSGVLSALHLCGLPVRDRHNQVYAQQPDPRVKAFIIFGYPLEYTGPSRADLKQIGPIPGLHIAGAADRPEYRQTSYRYVSGAPQYWVVVPGTHDVGSHGPLPLLQQITGRFMSAFLLGEQRARRRFVYTAFDDPHDDIVQFRTKLPGSRQLWDQRDFVAWARDVLPWGRWLHERGKAHPREEGASNP